VSVLSLVNRSAVNTLEGHLSRISDFPGLSQSRDATGHTRLALRGSPQFRQTICLSNFSQLLTSWMNQKMEKGAIVLCGGRSTRMGQDKASLPFGPERVLQRVVRRLSEVVDQNRIVVVSAINQDLPPLPERVLVTHDQNSERGPLEGMAAGFRAMPSDVDAIFVTSCDVPQLVPAFVERMFELLGQFDIAVPRDDQYVHPLAGIYRPSVLIRIQGLLDANVLRVRRLFEEVNTREIPMSQLRDVDPDLASLENLNLPEDYARALAKAGFAN
jgi:molybdopterin-guanine dinucleotide biosynthesis protein A